MLSTLHTNDAPSSITRLINIGIEPYLISASVNAVLAQRLVRRICANCKTPVKTRPRVRPGLPAEVPGRRPHQLYQGAGCDKCRQTGYKGRIGIYELLELERRPARPDHHQPVADRTAPRRPPGGHAGAAARTGCDKVAAGLTTVEEIMRVTET